jgi:hypothetical protein
VSARVHWLGFLRWRVGLGIMTAHGGLPCCQTGVGRSILPGTFDDRARVTCKRCIANLKKADAFAAEERRP